MSIPESKTHVEEDIKERCDSCWGYVYPVHNQNFVVMSILDGQPSSIKIFGVYSSLDEANRNSEKISKENDFFNVYVASTNAWVPIPPTPEFIENIEYQEKRLQEIKNSYAALKERDAKNLIAAMEQDKKNKETILDD